MDIGRNRSVGSEMWCEIRKFDRSRCPEIGGVLKLYEVMRSTLLQLPRL